MTRLACWTVMTICVAACSTDLFHSTNWSNVCDEDPSAATCQAGATSGSNGGHGGASSTTTSAVAESSASVGGAGGAGGGGGGAGGGGGIGGTCSTCQEVGQVVLDGTPSPDPSTLCQGASQDAWDAAFQCLCLDSCVAACTATACMLMQASAECQQCILNMCAGQAQTCQNN